MIISIMETVTLTHNAADPRLNYYGRWQAGPTAVSVTSGSLVELAYTGSTVDLLFDVEGFTRFPALFVQVDNGPVTGTALRNDVDRVRVVPPRYAAPEAPAARCHLARFWVAANSLYQAEATGLQWTTLDGGCRFRGLDVRGGELLELPYQERQIELLGDSITQGLRLLYAGTDDDTALQLPHANWPQYLADILGMKPVVTGFGGQGLTTPGTCGAPPAGAAFPLIHAAARWTPRVRPLVTVVYQGSNDLVAPNDFEAAYAMYLAQVRAAYPGTQLFAVCPHTRPGYAGSIRRAVAAQRDRHVHFLDYSEGVLAAADTSDGCHLNPGGAVALACRLAGDIASCIDRLDKNIPGGVSECK
jgi:lysophospholipase L1-like esterase